MADSPQTAALRLQASEVVWGNGLARVQADIHANTIDWVPALPSCGVVAVLVLGVSQPQTLSFGRAACSRLTPSACGLTWPKRGPSADRAGQSHLPTLLRAGVRNIAGLTLWKSSRGGDPADTKRTKKTYASGLRSWNKIASESSLLAHQRSTTSPREHLRPHSGSARTRPWSECPRPAGNCRIKSGAKTRRESTSSCRRLAWAGSSVFGVPVRPLTTGR